MHEVIAKSILSPQNGMNLYRGCLHGCIYCDARSTCYQMDHAFEDIAVKVNAPKLLEDALRRKRKRCMIGTGAMSDPYLPIEKELKLTRKCLELIDEYGFGLAIQTKSDLILRDLDLLKSINKKTKYLTNNLWFEVFRKIDEDTLLQYKAKKDSGKDEEDDLESLPNANKADFSPGYKEINKGTLQQRIWHKSARGGSDLLWDDNEPYIYILVTGKEKFKYVEQEVPQEYALVITFSYDGQEDKELYSKVKDNVKVRTRQTERERERGRLR